MGISQYPMKLDACFGFAWLFSCVGTWYGNDDSRLGLSKIGRLGFAACWLNEGKRVGAKMVGAKSKDFVGGTW